MPYSHRDVWIYPFAEKNKSKFTRRFNIFLQSNTKLDSQEIVLIYVMHLSLCKERTLLQTLENANLIRAYYKYINEFVDWNKFMSGRLIKSNLLFFPPNECFNSNNYISYSAMIKDIHFFL